jgi:glycosyltransferase involved in cell wall biosynthesis
VVSPTSSRDAELPDVGVVIATHHRPELMRKALASVLDQGYAGRIHVVLVFDRSEPEFALETADAHRSVSVTTNSRTPGLAGARNTGIMALDSELVGFCDDDDVWLPGKLEAQVGRLGAAPGSEFVTTAMRVDIDGRSTVRRAERSVVTISDLSRSRMAMLHSSSFLFRRAAMLDGFGLVDETIPRSMAEDWDLLIRAARRMPIQHVDEPYVAILWAATSYFNDAWADKNAAHSWLLEHHPEIRNDRVGAALQYGKLAFGNAVLGNRTTAVRLALRASRTHWKEPRGLLALGVAAGVSGRWIQEVLNRHGHGI